MRFFKLPRLLVLLIGITIACDNMSSNCDSAIWTTFISMDDITFTKGKMYRLPADPFELSLNAEIDRGLKDGYTLRENKVVGYIDSSSDSLQITYDGPISGPTTMKERYQYWIDSSYYEIDTTFKDTGIQIDSILHVDSVQRTYNKISFGYHIDSTNMYRYIIYGDFTPGCIVNTTNLSNEVNVTIIPDDSIHTIIKVYATIEEGYGHLNDLSVRNAVTFLIDDRK